MRFFRLIQIGLLILASPLATRAETPPVSTAPGNPLVWDAMEKKATLPGMTNLAQFTFWVTNTSSADIVIGSVDADCECTVVEARTEFPWTLAPAESGPLNVRVNIRGRFGDYIKTIAVNSTFGSQVLTVGMKIPLSPAPSNISVRQQDVMKAREDRQAVFRGNCAVCHAAPAVGLTGSALFEKACGICHQAEKRAEMVPDLASLKHAAGADHWRRWITSGKTGSLMLAFAQSEGGILDPTQIESLVKYLTEKFRSASQNK